MNRIVISSARLILSVWALVFLIVNISTGAMWMRIVAFVALLLGFVLAFFSGEQSSKLNKGLRIATAIVLAMLAVSLFVK